MKARIETLKKDLYNVFVMGNADDRQLYRVYLLLALPAITFMLMFGTFPKY
ncbi:hypothetical protein AAFN85_06190 [Mucilaginibacter sp. CAU 1740]|jgi:hypothetical protein|uniref:hypothetical protein n=1 Tax=Mucilaginibacter sp. CAU 1740 TaxID=3140365 RepID=UPI00325A9215